MSRYLIDSEENIIVDPVNIEIYIKGENVIIRFLTEKANYTLLAECEPTEEAALNYLKTLKV